MDAIEGLGDVTVMGLYTVYSDAPVRPRKRVTIGFGVKTPTGVSNETTSTGTKVYSRCWTGRHWHPLFGIFKYILIITGGDAYSRYNVLPKQYCSNNFVVKCTNTQHNCLVYID